MASIGEYHKNANVYKGLMFPRIVAEFGEMPAKSKAQYFPRNKMCNLPSIFKRKVQLRLPKTCLTRRGPLALWPHHRALGTSDEKYRNRQSVKTFSKVPASRDLLIAETPHYQPIETTRELKRGILNYNAQQSEQERDIKPGHSARQYVSYWRQCHRDDRCHHSVLAQMETHGQKICTVINTQTQVRQNQTVVRLKDSPSPYQIPNKLKTLTLQCCDCRKMHTKRLLSNEIRIPEGPRNMTYPNKLCSEGSSCYKCLRSSECPRVKNHTHITYPVYWINSHTSPCSHSDRFDVLEAGQCQKRITGNSSTVSSCMPQFNQRQNRSIAIGSASPTSFDVPEFNHQSKTIARASITSSDFPELNQHQNKTTDSASVMFSDFSELNMHQNRTIESASTMSSGNKYIRIKLGQVLNDAFTRMNSNHMCSPAQSASHISVESE